MSNSDTRVLFVRQSSWMMAANMFSGVFMAAAAFTIPNLTPSSDYSVFVTILRIFILVSLPASAMQAILAQQTAAAVTEEARKDVSATARGVLKMTFVFWLGLLALGGLFRSEIGGLLQASSPSLVWGMMALILGSLALPIFLGLLQGLQLFLPYGWSTIANGFGRFVAIAVGVKFFQISATGATIAAFAGFAVATLIAAWPGRVAFQFKPGKFEAAGFLKKVGLLTAGTGSTLFIINVDMILVQGHFPKEVSGFYAAAETIGIAVVTLCVPVAAVMFPKIVRSRATATRSNALNLAVTGTAWIAGASATVCTIFPELPLRILYFKNPELLRAASLIPWFMWAMVPVTIYNVLVNNLIARERYGIIPWAAILPIGYAAALYLFLANSHLPPFPTFKRVIQILMLFSTALMLVSIYFTRRALAEESGGKRSRPKDAKPS